MRFTPPPHSNNLFTVAKLVQRSPVLNRGLLLSYRYNIPENKNHLKKDLFLYNLSSNKSNNKQVDIYLP